MRESNTRIIDIACAILKQTEWAWYIDDGKTTAWVPKSLCEWDKDTKTMAMPEWVAKDRGFI